MRGHMFGKAPGTKDIEAGVPAELQIRVPQLEAWRQTVYKGTSPGTLEGRQTAKSFFATQAATGAGQPSTRNAWGPALAVLAFIPPVIGGVVLGRKYGWKASLAVLVIAAVTKGVVQASGPTVPGALFVGTRPFNPFFHEGSLRPTVAGAALLATLGGWGSRRIIKRKP